MYKEGDIIEGLGTVEPNHCGLPWVASIDGEYCGVIQVRDMRLNNTSHLCDALSGKELSQDEVDARLNNYNYDYENKSTDCINWRAKNQPYGPYGYRYSEATKLKIRLWKRISDFWRWVWAE